MKFSIINIFMLLVIGNTYAQTRKTDSVKILPEAIVVSGSKYEEKQKNIVQNIVQINRKEIDQSNAGNTGDLLEKSGSVFVQRSQQGGSSPVLRGFEANRVLMVVDGVRMNNAIYRGGHLQNVITIDPNMLESAEILFGSASTLFGSDALGGAMNFKTRDPLFATENELKVSANSFLRYATANEGITAHLDFSIAGQRLGSLTSFTSNRFSDLRAGANRDSRWGNWGLRNYYIDRINGVDTILSNSNPQLQIGSAYNQYDILQKFIFRQNDNVIHRLNIQYSTSSDVPRYDRLTDTSAGGILNTAEWYYGPQNRLLTSYELQLKKLRGFFNEARANISYQNIEESRNTRGYKSDGLTSRVENVGVLGYDINARHKGNKNELIAGTDAQLNSVNSTANIISITTGTVTAASTRYPSGGSTLNMFAIYAQDIYKINSNWVLNTGLRFSGNTLLAKFTDSTFFKFPYKEAYQKSTALTGNLGIVYLNDGFRLATGVNTAFRMPNIDDLTKVFDTKKGSKVVVPNTDLKPEHTINFDLSLSYSVKNDFVVEVSGFYTLLKNAMVLKPTTFNNADSILYDGALTPVQSMQNVAKGNIYGGSLMTRFKIINHLTAKANYTITKGTYDNGSTKTPLDHIPPAFGRIGVQYNKPKWNIEFYSQFNGWKHIADYSLSGEDNSQYATTSGMPSWMTYNIKGVYNFTKLVAIQVALENITDLHYRNFASGISAPGRNIIITLRGGF